MSALTDSRDYVGGLSKPSKMPGPTYSLPARACKVGAKLREVPGSTCAGCYALRGRYMFGSVQAALYRRLATIGLPEWPAMMAKAINKAPFFRWHDSGDIQSLEHLARIVEVCKLTPDTKHWLPTREVKLVRQFVKSNAIPSNLNIRLSATMVDGKPPTVASDWSRFLNTSTVHKAGKAIGFQCPAPTQGNSCQDCRACWDSSVANVSYHAH